MLRGRSLDGRRFKGYDTAPTYDLGRGFKLADNVSGEIVVPPSLVRDDSYRESRPGSVFIKVDRMGTSVHNHGRGSG